MNKQKTLIFSLSAILFLALSFIAYSFTEPTTMPSLYNPPINTGSKAQAKTGEIGASVFIDADNPNYYINPSGNSNVLGKILIQNTTMASDSPNTITTKGYVDEQVALVRSIVTGIQPLINGIHTQKDCTDAGGRVVSSSGTTELGQCQFDLSNCPVGWKQYGFYSTTQHTHCGTSPNYCNCGPEYDTPSSKNTGCDTNYHAWSNIAQETCGYSCGYTSCGYSACRCGESTNYRTCYATIIQIGCY